MGGIDGGKTWYVCDSSTCQSTTKLNDSSEEVKRSTQGKLAAATQKQSAEYLKPLFKLLRARVRPTNGLSCCAYSPGVVTESSVGHACPSRRDSALHAEATIPESQRLLSSLVHRQRTVAHWRHYGWVCESSYFLQDAVLTCPSVFTNVPHEKKSLQIKWLTS